MPPTAQLESQRLANDVQILLEKLDPVRWRREGAAEARKLLARVARRARALLNRSESVAPRLREQVHEVHSVVASFQAEAASAGHDGWQSLRERLHMAYEGLAQFLRSQSLGAASVRPTNYTRTAFHVASGLLALVLVQYVFSPRGMMVAAVGLAAVVWTLETLRRFSPRLNAALMWFFRRVAHAHEHHRVNSSTWYVTALAVLSVTVSPLACSVAVVVLALADPAAGLVGRRWGRTRLRANRSLEGSLTFLLTACGTAWATLLVYAPGMSWPAGLLVAAATAATATIAELYSTRLDDNFTVPVAAGFGASLALAGLGLA